MKGIRVNKILVSAFIVLSACKQGAISPAEYLRQSQSEERAGKRIMGTGLAYEFTAMPAELIAIRENTGKDGNTDKIGYHKRLSEIQDYLFVRIKIENTASSGSILQAGAGSDAVIQQRTQYYSFQAGKDIYCTCGKDTLQAADYQFEEHYNLSNYATISVAFPKCGAKNITVHFNDRASNNYGIAAELACNEQPQIKF